MKLKNVKMVREKEIRKNQLAFYVTQIFMCAKLFAKNCGQQVKLSSQNLDGQSVKIANDLAFLHNV